MELRKLGASGLDVSSICLGAAMFGFPDFGCDERAAGEIFAVYREHGGNFLDTADAYAGGVSEEIVGRLLRGCRDEVVLATKVGEALTPAPNHGGLSRSYIMRAIDASLRRLQTDYIDLYQIHSVDPRTPIEETLDALDACVRSGRVRYIGCSNIEAWRLAGALGISRERSLARFVSAQLRYSLVAREIEREHLPLCEEAGLGVLAFNPLAAGLLTGKVSRGEDPPPDSRLAKADRYAGALTERAYAILDRLGEVADRLGARPAQVALAWALGRPGISSVINGARSAGQIRENLGALSLTLPEEDRAALDAISAERLGYPYEMLLEIEEMMMRTPEHAEQFVWPSAWRGHTWR